MPTTHREGGFRFRIYTDDHLPAHVHAYKAGAVAKIVLGDEDTPPHPVDVVVMATPEVRRAVRIVEAHQAEFLSKWREIHG